MALAANRHASGLNCVFFDGHAKWQKPQTIDASKTLTGCTLIHDYPLVSDGMCDASVPGCPNTDAANICNQFTYP
jgi:prepilin-type processing-associated H-X9-DG protein